MEYSFGIEKYNKQDNYDGVPVAINMDEKKVIVLQATKSRPSIKKKKEPILNNIIREGLNNTRSKILLGDGYLNYFKPYSRMLISGTSGSGKSTYVSNILKNYKKMAGKKAASIYVMSPINNDPAFKGLGIHYLDPEIVDDEFNINEAIEDMRDSIIIFDDCESIEKKIRKKVDEFVRAVYTRGRHVNLSCIYILHDLHSGEGLNKILLMESSHVMSFGNDIYHLERYLRQYMGVKDIKTVIGDKKRSRWIFMSKESPYPQYYMTEELISMFDIYE